MNVCSKQIQLIIFALLISIGITSVYAQGLINSRPTKDYGVRGHTFVIKERSLLQVIQERLQIALQNGKIELLQKQFQEKVKQKISNPVAVSGIQKATITRQFYFDPSYTQVEDVKDASGNIIVNKGTTVNPLHYVSWGSALVFIDGEDESQLTWGLKQQGKLILVKGAPLKLQEKLRRAVYFDQAGILTRKFGITQVPAKVSQEGMQLKIEEVVL
jgi:conjugal transfer pilus assembly protein TraW